MKSRKERAKSRARFWEMTACGRKGHLTYVPDESFLARHLMAQTTQGDAWRCLRCGDYVVGQPHGSGPADDAPVPKRGAQIRETIIMRFLALERLIRCFVLWAAAYGIWKFDGKKGAVQDAVNSYLPNLRDLSRRMNVNLTDAAPMRLINDALHSNHHKLMLVVLAVAIYGFVEGLEGVGLWSMQRWGEYVAVIGTSAFLPLEIYELTEKFSPLKTCTFLINVALVVWLIVSKRLFGVRGGTAEFEKQRHSASIMEITKRAAVQSSKEA